MTFYIWFSISTTAVSFFRKLKIIFDNRARRLFEGQRITLRGQASWRHVAHVKWLKAQKNFIFLPDCKFCLFHKGEINSGSYLQLTLSVIYYKCTITFKKLVSVRKNSMQQCKTFYIETRFHNTIANGGWPLWEYCDANLWLLHGPQW